MKYSYDEFKRYIAERDAETEEILYLCWKDLKQYEKDSCSVFELSKEQIDLWDLMKERYSYRDIFTLPKYDNGVDIVVLGESETKDVKAFILYR